MSDDLQEIKEEIAGLGTRMGNVEGYFNNFDVTLTNHMTDYKITQQSMDKKINNVESKLTWGFWVIFGLLTTVLAGFITGFIVLLQRLLGG